MARSLLDRLRGAAETAPGEPDAPPPPRAPSPGAIRRERRALLREREERLRDLGGLALEMFRHDRLRPELLRGQCGELLELDARLLELEELLHAATAARRFGGAPSCVCGAPLAWGAHFCANCGRPSGAPVVICAHCGSPLPADARFCTTCGETAEPADDGPASPDDG